jgi:hypothetical protein
MLKALEIFIQEVLARGEIPINEMYSFQRERWTSAV